MRRGFTLLELLVAVTITSIIMVVLLSMTGVVADAWKNGNNKIFTNAEARAGFNRLADDLDCAVIRDTIPGAEWFVATQNKGDFGSMPEPTNPTWLMFYTTPTDRDLKNAGNVIATSYKIVPQDPISGKAEFQLYGLYRAFPAGANPAQITFDSALGKPDLKAFWGSRPEASDKDNFYISNIFDFSFTFWVSVTGADGKVQTIALPPGSEIRLTSENLIVGSTTYPGGKLAAVDISMTILTQQGAQLARANDTGGDIKKFIANQDNARTYAHKVYFSPQAQRVYK